MQKAIQIGQQVRIGVPKFWILKDGTHDHAFDKRSDAIHFAEGYKEVITPIAGTDYNPETQRLGAIFLNTTIDKFTYPILNIPQDVLRQRVIGQAESIREERLQSTLKKQVEQQYQAIANDSEALENQEAFPLWTSFEDGHTFPIGFKVQHLEGLEMKLYRTLQLHQKQANWFPENVPALFVKILPAGAPLVWEVGIAVTVGQEYLYTPNGNTYIVLQAHTTQAGWAPPNVPALWQLKVI